MLELSIMFEIFKFRYGLVLQQNSAENFYIFIIK